MNRIVGRKIKAFSLLEIIVVLGIFFAISVIALPIAISQIQISRAEAVLKDIRSAMFVTSQDAYAQKDNVAYGIAFYTDHYIVYTGNSLATALTQESFTVADPTSLSNISFGGISELKFINGSFKPTAGGSLEITDGTDSYRLNISAQGLITYIKL